MRYPATPTLSVDADHERFICEEEKAVAVRFCGMVGAWVSEEGGGATLPLPALTIIDLIVFPLPEKQDSVYVRILYERSIVATTRSVPDEVFWPDHNPEAKHEDAPREDHVILMSLDEAVSEITLWLMESAGPAGGIHEEGIAGAVPPF